MAQILAPSRPQARVAVSLLRQFELDCRKFGLMTYYESNIRFILLSFLRVVRQLDASDKCLVEEGMSHRPIGSVGHVHCLGTTEVFYGTFIPIECALDGCYETLHYTFTLKRKGLQVFAHNITIK